MATRPRPDVLPDATAVMDPQADGRERVVSRRPTAKAIEFLRDLLLAACHIPRVDNEILYCLFQRISIPLGVEAPKPA